MIEQGGARLVRSADLAQAAWIQERVAGSGAGLRSILPVGFPVYVRVLHPAYGSWSEQPELVVRWAEVAERAGMTMHASIDFDELAAALDARAGSEAWDVSEPDTGNLDPEPLAALCDILARHTATPEACWFGVWDGHGWLHPGGVLVAVLTGADPVVDSDGTESPPIDQGDPVRGLTWNEPSPTMPLFELPWREHRLLSGPLDAALEIGAVVNGVFFPHSPSLIWPDDHAWCVATDVDLRSTYIAATPALADELVSDDRLEAWPVSPDDPLS